jgi:hypothetical protein
MVVSRIMACPPPSPTTEQPVQRVRFDKAEPQSFMDDHEFSETEKQNYWFQRADFASFEREKRASARALKRSRGDFSKLDTKLFCFRGIEEILDESYARHMQKQRQIHIQVVLMEHRRQRERDEINEHQLQQASSSGSEMAMRHAIELAQHDARVAQGREEVIPPLDVFSPEIPITERATPKELESPPRRQKLPVHCLCTTKHSQALVVESN